MDEAKQLPRNKRPAWVPKSRSGKIKHKKPIPVSGVVSTILSTTNGERITVDKKEARATRSETRGRKQKTIPLDYIDELAKAGMGSKQIATMLKTEKGVNCSYRTIARRLMESKP